MEFHSSKVGSGFVTSVCQAMGRGEFELGVVRNYVACPGNETLPANNPLPPDGAHFRVDWDRPTPSIISPRIGSTHGDRAPVPTRGHRPLEALGDRLGLKKTFIAIPIIARKQKRTFFSGALFSGVLDPWNTDFLALSFAPALLFSRNLFFSFLVVFSYVFQTF